MTETFTEAYHRLFEAPTTKKCEHKTWRVLWGMRHRKRCADCGLVVVDERLESF